MNSKSRIVFLILAALIPLSYALYTAHVWEDYYITFKFSKNLIEGNGLVYNIGEKVHGFTSPLGTLIPAFCYWLGHSDSSAIWLFRILFCIPAYVGSAYFFLKITEKLFPDRLIPALFCLFIYLTDAKSVMFSVNGMETAFMLFFLSWTCFIAISGFQDKYFQIGIAWAGLMWTRPDSCVYIAAFALSSLIFIDVPRKSQIKIFLKAALLCTLLYLPWFLWAWHYYGSPVPNTVMAKGMAISSSADLFFLLLKGLKRIFFISGWTFFPVYPHFGPWPYVFVVFSLFTGALSAILFLYRKASKMQKFFSFFFIAVLFYLSIIDKPYPWYFPAAALIGILSFSSAIDMILNSLMPKGKEKLKIAILAILAIGFMTFFLSEVDRMKRQQSIIETGNRAVIGKWLKENAKAGESVYLESLGYIGYFSDRKMIDWPGLISPGMVRARKEKNVGFVTAIKEMNPDWVLCRALDMEEMENNPFIREKYHMLRDFDVRDKVIERSKNIYGINYLLYDSIYCAFRKND